MILDSKRRSAITLLELIIVMVILVAVGALVAPTIQRSFGSQRATKAAQLVRSGLNRARVSAMRTGEIYGFFYFPESRDFKIAPFNNEMMSSLQRGSQRDTTSSGSNYDYGNDRLPQGILFTEGTTQADARSEDALAQNDVRDRSVRPVLFYPDGSSQTASLMVKTASEEDFVEIRLRGMTGSSRIVPIEDSQIRR